MKKRLIAGMSGPQYRRILDAVMEFPFATTPPHDLDIRARSIIPDEKWREVLRSADTKTSALACWAETTEQTDALPNQISVVPNSELVVFAYDDAFDELADAMALIEPLPFELCSLGTPFNSTWYKADYERTGFGRSNLPHGWGCVLRGAGHDRLVSRRWLDFGPWRVIRRPDDTTWIQFYDLAITDPAEAYAQAWPGHQRMGNDPTGGYIGHHDSMLVEGAEKEGGLYDRDRRVIELVVPPGGVIPQGNMLGQCARRLHHRRKPRATAPVDNIAYVFLDHTDADAHLHELWLRELECWHVDASGKHRLDADYRPVPPEPPTWVRRLDGK